jgi:hypothetical protein
VQVPAGSVFRFAPLGIPTTIIADDSALLDAAVESVAGSGAEAVDGEPGLIMRLRWNELATATVGFGVSVKGSHLVLEGAGVLGRADASTREAECSISRAYGGERGLLAEIAETLLLFLLARCGRIPVHAAAIVIGDTAIVLAGPSGAGKSSLACEAQRQGVEVLSDDTCYVQLQPRLRLWGWPGAIHLHARDAPAGDHPTRVRGGVVKQAISRAPARHFAERAILVAIEPGTDLQLVRADPRGLIRGLPLDEPGFVLLRPQVEAALRALAREGAWRLTLSRRADAAIALLRERFRPGRK